MSLCTRQNVKDFLQLANTDTSKDDLIDLLIPAAQGFVEEYCKRIFEKQEYTEFYNGGVDRVFVKNPPIWATPAPVVYEDWEREFSEEDKVDSTDMSVDYDVGILYFDYELAKAYNSIKVVYTGGFPQIPAAVRQACVELVARKVRTSNTGDIGVSSKSTPAGALNVNFDMSEILLETKKALDLYVR